MRWHNAPESERSLRANALEEIHIHWDERPRLAFPRDILYARNEWDWDSDVLVPLARLSRLTPGEERWVGEQLRRNIQHRLLNKRYDSPSESYILPRDVRQLAGRVFEERHRGAESKIMRPVTPPSCLGSGASTARAPNTPESKSIDMFWSPPASKPAFKTEADFPALYYRGSLPGDAHGKSEKEDILEELVPLMGKIAEWMKRD